MSALFQGEGLALVRGGRLLFDGLDLALEPGDALHLVGPNGSGKSSLLRLAAGLLSPTAGRLTRARAALADDKVALDPDLALGRALGFWCGAATGPAMAAMNLDRLGQVPVRMLSTGQLRRARLARVAASGAPLWLLDEPLNGLDSDSAERLDRMIAAHRASGGAVIAASHVPLTGEWRTLALGH
jgi:heme exporter protein A